MFDNTDPLFDNTMTGNTMRLVISGKVQQFVRSPCLGDVFCFWYKTKDNCIILSPLGTPPPTTDSQFRWCNDTWNCLPYGRRWGGFADQCQAQETHSFSSKWEIVAVPGVQCGWRRETSDERDKNSSEAAYVIRSRRLTLFGRPFRTRRTLLCGWSREGVSFLGKKKGALHLADVNGQGRPKDWWLGLRHATFIFAQLWRCSSGVRGCDNDAVFGRSVLFPVLRRAGLHQLFHQLSFLPAVWCPV